MRLGASSAQDSRKGGVHAHDIHRAGVAKLGNLPWGEARILAQPAINVSLTLTCVDEPVVQPLDLLNRPAQDGLVEGDVSVHSLHQRCQNAARGGP
jgi:hypothetical protein